MTPIPSTTADSALPALTRALDAALLRHRVIAMNVAHAGVGGYRSHAVRFEAAPAPGRDRAAPDGLVPTFTAQGPVQLDSEMVAMARNAAHYQALLRGVSRQLALLHSAVSDGRR